MSHSLIYLTAYCRSTRRSACKEHGRLTCAVVEGQLIDMCDDYLSHYVAGTRHVNHRRGAIICYRYPANKIHVDNAGVRLGHRPTLLQHWVDDTRYLDNVGLMLSHRR